MNADTAHAKLSAHNAHHKICTRGDFFRQRNLLESQWACGAMIQSVSIFAPVRTYIFWSECANRPPTCHRRAAAAFCRPCRKISRGISAALLNASARARFRSNMLSGLIIILLPFVSTLWKQLHPFINKRTYEIFASACFYFHKFSAACVAGSAAAVVAWDHSRCFSNRILLAQKSCKHLHSI